MDTISYIDYDKISDDMMYLGQKTVLRFNVTLAKKDINGNRRHFHNEYKYSSKYIDYGDVISIRRNYGYYMSIDKTDCRECSVMIRLQDMLILRSKLKEVSLWFTSGVFAIKRNKLVIINKPESVVIDNLAEGKYIMFEPVVIEWENTGTIQEGVRLTLVKQDVFIDVNIDTFYAFLYLMNTCDMFLYAQNMINYISRPEYGTNMYEFESMDDNAYEEPEKTIFKSKDRQIPGLRKPRSFFDRLDDE